jgi:hypothetical protein
LKTKAKLFCSTNANEISAQDISKLNWLLPTHKIENCIDFLLAHAPLHGVLMPLKLLKTWEFLESLD